MSGVPIMFSIALGITIFATFVHVEIEFTRLHWRAKALYSLIFWVVVAWFVL